MVSVPRFFDRIVVSAHLLLVEMHCLCLPFEIAKKFVVPVLVMSEKDGGAEAVVSFQGRPSEVAPHVMRE